MCFNKVKLGNGPLDDNVNNIFFQLIRIKLKIEKLSVIIGNIFKPMQLWKQYHLLFCNALKIMNFR